MNDATKAKFAAIFAAQLAKAEGTTTPPAAKVKALPTSTTPAPTPKPAPAPAPAPAPKPQPPASKMPEVREFTNLEDLTNAAKNGETVSILNMYNLVNANKKTPAAAPAPRRELSTVTFADLMNNTTPQETPGTEPAEEIPAPDPSAAAQVGPAHDIVLLPYSGISFVARGKDTYQIRTELREKGGTYNKYLKGGPGWIFANKKFFTVKTLLEKSKFARRAAK